MPAKESVISKIMAIKNLSTKELIEKYAELFDVKSRLQITGYISGNVSPLEFKNWNTAVFRVMPRINSKN